MKYITLETECNLFGKPKRFIDIVASQPIAAEILFKSMPDYIMDCATVTRICWMFPESTNAIVDRIIKRNNERIFKRNQEMSERVGKNRYYTSMNGSEVRYLDESLSVVVTERIKRPVDMLNELFA